MNRRVLCVAVSALTVLGGPALAGSLPIITKCPPDAVLVGQTCVDTYEGSVWEVPPTNGSGKSNAGLINKIKQGKAKLADLTAGSATQISPSASCSPAFPGTFPANGQWTAPLYAVSIAGVHPTACVTWFQADQACRLSGKRLLTNGEWQSAAAGTPDGSVGDNGTTDCNTVTASDVVNTGSRANCKSNYGAFDMVGNVDEWVQDWMPRSTGCGSWSSSSDFQCLAGAATTGEPGALFRGGDGFPSSTGAGPFAVGGGVSPSASGFNFGFRCAR